MSTIAPDQVIEADEVRAELELLEDAMALLRAELDQAYGDRDSARILLGDAVELRHALEDRLFELEDELRLEKLRSAIRRRLLAGVTDARTWQRRKAIARAKRVERLLAA
jgi:hypothetical protein